MAKNKPAQEEEIKEPVEGAEVDADETDEKSSKGVTVAFEGNQTRTYTGKTAKADAASFVSKRPADRSIVK